MSPTQKGCVNISYVRSRGYLLQNMVVNGNEKSIVTANFGCITKIFAKEITRMYRIHKGIFDKEELTMEKICEKKLESGLEIFHLAISLLRYLHERKEDSDGLVEADAEQNFEELCDMGRGFFFKKDSNTSTEANGRVGETPLALQGKPRG